MPAPRPTYLDTQPDPVLAFLHEPVDGRAEATGVLVCPPWGWDEVASYRSRRAWAERLAEAGHPTLRLELPATGNSGGSPRDADRLDAWVGAITVAADRLRSRGPCARVAILGLGLGGLLAREALARGARAEEAVLWGAPASGRAFVRETQAFSRLQAWSSEEGASGLHAGALEAGGFLLTAETITALRALRPEPPPAGTLERVLLVERDGVAVDEKLRELLEGAEVDVAVAPGAGWADFVSHAERTRFPEAVAKRVAAWLTEGEGPGRPARARIAPVVEEVERLAIDVDGTAVAERPLSTELSFGRAFGVLAEPLEAPASDLVALCLNAGAVRNIGPNRIWVETGRRWAALGVRTLRVDLEGIGESDGVEPPDVAGYYAPKFEQQLRELLDRLEGEGLGSRFVLVGLCGSGYWAFRETLEDPRVRSALLLNSGALEWDPALIAEREARKLGYATEIGRWRKLLRGEVGLRKVWKLVASLVRDLGRRLRLVGRSAADPAHIEADLDRLCDAGTPLTMAFSANEPLHEELQAGGILDRLERWPNVDLQALPGADHTLRPLDAQAGARELLDRGLRAALGPLPDYEVSRGPSGPADRGSRARGRARGRGARRPAPTRRR